MEQPSFSGDAMRFFSVMNGMRKAWRRISPCPQLNKSQFGTLWAISCGGDPALSKGKKPLSDPVPLSILASSMGQSLPSISQRIRVLEEMGYVKRMEDPKDRRVTGVCLTSFGETLLKQSIVSMRNALEQLLAGIDPHQLQIYFQVSEKLVEGLETIAALEIQTDGRNETC